MAIDKEAVKYTAHLARIELGEKELEKLSGQLHDIVGFIDTLREVDLTGVEATSHILDVKNVMRGDVVTGSLGGEKVLGNAPKTDGVFFVVPAVIE